MAGRRIDIASGPNEFDRRLGRFRVDIQVPGLDGPEATITATVLAPPHLNERHRASRIRISTTVEFSTPIQDAIELAVKVLRAARAAGIQLPSGVSLG